MKKLLIATIAAATITSGVFMTSGCKSGEIPSTDDVRTIAISIGAASGTICKMSVTNQQTIVVLTNIMTRLEAAIPEVDESCAETWRPIVLSLVEEAVAAGQIPEDEGAVIYHVTMAAAHGIDWMFKLHPTWKKYSDLAAAGVKGFCNGFLLTVTVKNNSLMYKCIVIDPVAYEYFKNTYKFML